MFLLKHLLKPLILPPVLWMIPLLIGIIYRHRRWSRKLLLVTFILIYLMHSRVFHTAFTWPLESAYPPLFDPRRAGAYDAIVSLTAGASGPSGLIPFAHLEDPQFPRLEETVRLYRLNPKPVIISGGPPARNRIICDYLIGMGVPAGEVLAEAVSRDTFESASEVGKLLKAKGWRRYLLVTSAFHMPRSMLVFARMAGEPIPAPGAFTVQKLAWARLIPTETAALPIVWSVYEYYGLLNYRLRLLYDR